MRRPRAAAQAGQASATASVPALLTLPLTLPYARRAALTITAAVDRRVGMRGIAHGQRAPPPPWCRRCSR